MWGETRVTRIRVRLSAFRCDALVCLFGRGASSGGRLVHVEEQLKARGFRCGRWGLRVRVIGSFGAVCTLGMWWCAGRAWGSVLPGRTTAFSLSGLERDFDLHIRVGGPCLAQRRHGLEGGPGLAWRNASLSGVVKPSGTSATRISVAVQRKPRADPAVLWDPSSGEGDSTHVAPGALRNQASHGPRIGNRWLHLIPVTFDMGWAAPPKPREIARVGEGGAWMHKMTMEWEPHENRPAPLPLQTRR